jgi:dienelactone hydrolase
LRFELEGFRPYEAAAAFWDLDDPLPLDRVGALADGVVHVPGGQFGPGPVRKRLRLNSYLIDRFEVTNRRYKAFIDAGGYQRPEFWRQPFVQDGRPISWEKGVARFTDRTGRPGPSTWELSTYPRGQDEYPVSGVSWYEAAAYAAFEGRDLPTFFHWQRAAGGAGPIVLSSNFADRGPAPVGQYQGMSPYGCLDMAGNVREWVFNAGVGGSGRRFILGGGWNDPRYAFGGTGTQSPWDRSPTNGLRLVTYSEASSNLESAKLPVETINAADRDYSREKPVSDSEFKVYQHLYGYDRSALNPVLEQRTIEAEWTREKVSFDAAYGKARVIAYVFLPPASRRPYQTIIFFPGTHAQFMSSFDDESLFWDFIVRSGRALVFPIYRGTFERSAELPPSPPKPTVAYRDAVIQWTQDLRRTLDYLETRDEFDPEKIGYFGHSWGGALGGLIPAVEPRLRAVVLNVAGLYFVRSQPEADPFNFLPRVRVPVLMLNGRYDEYFPLETSQVPMFRALGVPPSQKRHVIYEDAHRVPRDQLIRETLAWYDRYLGPVATTAKTRPARP